MASPTFTIVPIPFWLFNDVNGVPLGGGYMHTYRSLNKTEDKFIFTDSSGNTPWPDPVFFNANGEAPGPFFWENDEPYYIEIFDAQNNKVFTMDGYGPGIAGGGGGGSTTVNTSIDNFVLNNVFWRNQGSISGAKNGTVLAPSNHAGFVFNNNTGVANLPAVGPDVLYIKTGSADTDNISFDTTDFSAGSNPLTGDVTPEFYLDFHCTSGSADSNKSILFPLDLHVKNFETQTMTGIIWARNPGGGLVNLQMNFVQFFGTGSATMPVITPILLASPLSNSWFPYSATFTVPSVNAKPLGAGGDDATYLQVLFPTVGPSQIFIAKPKLYLGTIGSVFPELQTYDFVDGTISLPRTGDYRSSLNSVAPFGWVAANDGTIGDSSSGATNRNNIDTWPLYSLIWNSVPDSLAPVVGGRTTSAIADFALHKPITLTKTLGRVLAGLNAQTNTALSFTTSIGSNPNELIFSPALGQGVLLTGTPVYLTGGSLPGGLLANTIYFVIFVDSTHIKLAQAVEYAQAGTPIETITSDGSGTIQTALGFFNGESFHTLSVSELASHAHTASLFSTAAGANTRFSNFNTGGAATNTGTTDSNGGNVPHNTIQPTTYVNVFLKL